MDIKSKTQAIFQSALRGIRTRQIHFLAIGFGGACGALVREWVVYFISSGSWAILLCNVLSSLMLATILELRNILPRALVDMIAIGFCGGLSIFASFSEASVRAFQHQQYFTMWFNVISNFAICIGAIFAVEYAFFKTRQYYQLKKNAELQAKASILARIKNKIFSIFTPKQSFFKGNKK